MEQLKKIICLLLSFSVIAIMPFKSFAAVSITAPSISVADYAFSLVLDSCGIGTSMAGVSSMLGQWDTYTDYQDKGKRGELSAYSQWLYNRAHTAKAEEARKKYLDQEKVMTNWPSVKWGEKIDITGTYETVKEWLSSFPTYRTDSKVYKDTSTVLEMNKDIVKPSGTGKYIFTTVDDTFKANYYFINADQSPANLVAVRGNYNTRFESYYVNLYYVESSAKYYVTTLRQSWRDVSQSGKVFTGDKDMLMRNMLFNSSTIASFPFPVFSSAQAMESYVSSGAIGSVVNSTVTGLPIQEVRPSVQKAITSAVPSAISLPTTADLAQQLLDQIRASNDAALKSALANAGFAIDWTLDDVGERTTAASEEGEKVISGKLADILAKVEAIPVAIDTFFNNKMEKEETTDENTRRLSIPSEIAQKFPFCIPFDIAYLVTSLQSTSEVPRFELPIKFDYMSFHYDQIFTVDMSQWNTAVQIFRIMLDILFVAGLIAATRTLIRG